MNKEERAKANHSFLTLRNMSRTRLDVNGDPIEWHLTFDEWLQIWHDSGHWDERGPGRGQYVMSRYDDIGHYEAGNVFIQLGGKNIAESNRRRVGVLNPNYGKPFADPVLVAARGRAMAKVEHNCPHCGKVGRGLTMLRWHFDHCKHREQDHE